MANYDGAARTNYDRTVDRLITQPPRRAASSLEKIMNEAQIEAVANADAHTSNAGLPTYTELLAALEHISGLFSQDNPRPPVWIAQDMATIARATLAKAAPCSAST